MTPVIWMSVTVATVVAAFVIRFGNVARAQSLSWPPPAAHSQGGASSQVSEMCSL